MEETLKEVFVVRIICIRVCREEDPCPCRFSLFQPSGPLRLTILLLPTLPQGKEMVGIEGKGTGISAGGLTVRWQSRRRVSAMWAGGGCSLAHTYIMLEKSQWKQSFTCAPQGKVTVLLSGSGRKNPVRSAPGGPRLLRGSHQQPPADRCP